MKILRVNPSVLLNAKVFLYKSPSLFFSLFMGIALILPTELAKAQTCFQTMTTGRCEVCPTFSPAAIGSGSDCMPCAAVCGSWGLLQDSAVGELETKGYKVDKVDTQEGSVVVINTNPVIPPNTEPFSTLEDIAEIGKVNPHAAIILLRFNPEYFIGATFTKGSAGAPGRATLETLQLKIDHEKDLNYIESTLTPLEKGDYIDMTWEHNKAVNLWIFRTMIRDKEGASYGPAYPDIEVSVSHDKPYRMTGWAAR